MIRHFSNLMEYKRLGNSGLKISRLGLGNWGNATDGQQEINSALVKHAWEAGINFFDTAEGYGKGKGEVYFGVALKSLNVPRSDYVVSTKIYWGVSSESTTSQNNLGTSRKRIMEGLSKSLSNLQLDYVDILYCHRYDIETPTKEVCETMRDIISSGKALYWATSMWPPIRVMEAMLICDIIGCPRPIAEQCEYNMLERESIEKDYVTLFDDYQLGTTIWSPLASGILTGKYNEGFPADSRFYKDWYRKSNFNKYLPSIEEDLKKLKAIAEIAATLECSMAQLAIAWTLSTPDVTTAILGASSVFQLEQNIKAIKVKDKLSKEILLKIDDILLNKPQLGIDWRTSDRKSIPSRR